MQFTVFFSVFARIREQLAHPIVVRKKPSLQIASCMIAKIIITIHHGLLIYDNSLLLCLFDKLSLPLYDTDKIIRIVNNSLEGASHRAFVCAPLRSS